MAAKRGKRMKKPDIIFHYNEHKGAVDTFDKMATSIALPFRFNKWNKKLFFFYMDICLFNAFILYRG